MNPITCCGLSNHQPLLSRNDRLCGVTYNTQLLVILNINLKEAWLSEICTHRTVTFATNSIPDFTAHHLSNPGYI